MRTEQFYFVFHNIIAQHRWIVKGYSKKCDKFFERIRTLPDAQFSVTRTAKEQDAIMAKMRSILQNGGTAADLRSYVDTLDAQERAQAKKKPQGTNTQRRADAASQIVRAAHDADMTVEEYLRENAELYETEDGWNRDARRALEMERGRLLHLDKKRSQSLIAGLPGSNSPGTMRSVDFENSIRHFWENVK